jgi:UDP-N-acetylmuramoyl-L-alanyl-D-glutamate--2,6-diaminopimelate ligase
MRASSTTGGVRSDLVLILGKGHEQGQDIDGVIEPFDDRSVVAEFLGAG